MQFCCTERSYLPLLEKLIAWMLFFILKCNNKNVLLRSSEGGHLQFPVRVCGINGMHTLVCFNN